jgi:hypothetical protein
MNSGLRGRERNEFRSTGRGKKEAARLLNAPGRPTFDRREPQTSGLHCLTMSVGKETWVYFTMSLSARKRRTLGLT